VPGFDVDRDAVRQAASGGDDPLVGTVGTDGKNAALGQVEDEETIGWLHGRLAVIYGACSLSSVPGMPQRKADRKLM
jgi:hypothetical protein